MDKPTIIAKGAIYRIGVVIVAIVAYLYLPGIPQFLEDGITYLWYRDFEGLRQFILAYGLWAPVCSILLMTLQSLVPFVPGLAITITNAWIFGWQYGAIYSWMGALMGASLDFGIARWYGRPVVEKFVDVKCLKIMNTFLQRHGILSVFITRLTPIIPFKVVSYGVGLSTLSFAQFVIATAIGQAPAILLYSIIGQNITHSAHATIMIASVLIIIAAIVHYYRDDLERRFSSDKESQGKK
jgi:uncharacterized membrane protein YdjX (TVP38/TMEM64 family)